MVLLPEVRLGHSTQITAADTHVVVNQDVAQAANGFRSQPLTTPGDLRVGGPQLLGELLARFTNDLELSNDGVLPVGFGNELSAPDAGVLFEAQNGVADMEEIGPVSKPSRFHKGIASFRTASRI